MSDELVQGVNADRIGEFKVSYELLREVMEMPFTTTVLSVRPRDEYSFVVRVAHRHLPLCPVDQPTQLTPTVTKERTVWDWGLK